MTTARIPAQEAFNIMYKWVIKQLPAIPTHDVVDTKYATLGWSCAEMLKAIEDMEVDVTAPVK